MINGNVFLNAGFLVVVKVTVEGVLVVSDNLEIDKLELKVVDVIFGILKAVELLVSSTFSVKFRLLNSSKTVLIALAIGNGPSSQNLPV